MIIGSALFGLAILIVVVLFLAKPFFKERGRPINELSERQKLENEKEALLIQIRALEFDHDTGKLPTEVYEAQRAVLVDQAAATLKEIDNLVVGEDQEIYAQIEAAVTAMRRQPAPAGNGQAAYCTNCGRSLDTGDKFCAGCGQPVAKVEPTF